MNRLHWSAIGPTVNGRTLVQHRDTGVYALAIASRTNLYAIDQRRAQELLAPGVVEPSPKPERN